MKNATEMVCQIFSRIYALCAAARINTRLLFALARSDVSQKQTSDDARYHGNVLFFGGLRPRTTGAGRASAQDQDGSMPIGHKSSWHIYYEPETSKGFPFGTPVSETGGTGRLTRCRIRLNERMYGRALRVCASGKSDLRLPTARSVANVSGGIRFYWADSNWVLFSFFFFVLTTTPCSKYYCRHKDLCYSSYRYSCVKIPIIDQRQC